MLVGPQQRLKGLWVVLMGPEGAGKSVEEFSGSMEWD